jgi:hypothetical protein
MAAELPPDPRSIWVTDEPSADPVRRAKHELVRQVKRTVEAAALLDMSRTGPEELEAILAGATTLADQAEGLPSLADRGGPVLAGGTDATLVERSGISGRSNPIAPPLYMHVFGERTRAWAYYTSVYEGPPGCLHGGFVAAAFDDVMGVAQMVSGNAGYTGTLTVRMRRPTPLFRRIDYEAWVDRAEGRKIWVKATSAVAGELVADAEILFIAPAGGGIIQNLADP